MNDFKAPPSSKPMSTAEVYALSLRKRIAAAISAKEQPTPRSIETSERGPVSKELARQEIGWRMIILPWHEALTIDDLRDDLNTGLIAAGSPQGAAVYAGEEIDRGATVILSPAAARIFSTMKIMKAAVACDQPAEHEATLLCGDEGRMTVA